MWGVCIKGTPTPSAYPRASCAPAYILLPGYFCIAHTLAKDLLKTHDINLKVLGTIEKSSDPESSSCQVRYAGIERWQWWKEGVHCKRATRALQAMRKVLRRETSRGHLIANEKEKRATQNELVVGSSGTPILTLFGYPDTRKSILTAGKNLLHA